MVARVQAWLLLCWLAAWAWPLALVRDGRWQAAACAGLVLLFGHALWLAIGLLMAHVHNRHDPAPRAHAADLLRAWWGELRTAPLVFGWRQPLRSQAWPDHVPAGARGRVGVVLVHGFICNRGLWNPWLRRLTLREVPFVAVNLEPMLGDIDAYPPLIEAAVARLEAATGVKPVLVGHSMGGLAIRAWLRGGGNERRVRRVLTLGSPHQGTALAAWAVSENGRQMQVGGPWLQALAADETPARRRLFTCLYSHADNIVYPASTAALPGAAHEHVAGTAHIHLVEHPQAWQALERALSAAEPG